MHDDKARFGYWYLYLNSFSSPQLHLIHQHHLPPLPQWDPQVAASKQWIGLHALGAEGVLPGR